MNDSKFLKIETKSYALSTFPGYLHTRHDGNATVTTGEIHTPEGVVTVVSQLGDYPYTNLLIVAEGRVHIRRFNEGYQPRYLRTLANRFAEEFSS